MIRAALAFIFFPLACLGQEDTVITGLREPLCQEEKDILFPPGAVVFSNTLADLPLKKDLSDFLPAIGDQGQQGSCTAFAVAEAITILYNQAKQKRYNLSEIMDYTNWYSPAFIFNIGKAKYPYPRSEDCSDGISYIDAFLVARDYGVARWPLAKYLSTSNAGCVNKYYPSASVLKQAAKDKIVTFQRLDLDLDLFKNLLAEEPGYPICISVVVDQGYKKASNKENGCVWSAKSQSIPRQVNAKHAMVIVGYDDQKQCFKVLDSKGFQKGEGGFIWLSYKLLEQRVIYDAYVCSFDDKLLRAQKNSGEKELDLSNGIPEETWLKESYFRAFNGFRIWCIDIDKSEQTATFRISNNFTQEVLVPEIMLRMNSQKFFTLRGRTFSIFLKKFGIRGKNPFKPAAVLDISLLGEKVMEQFVKEGQSKRLLQTLRLLGLVSELNESANQTIENLLNKEVPQEVGKPTKRQSIYVGTNTSLAIGTIVDSKNNAIMPKLSMFDSLITKSPMFDAPAYTIDRVKEFPFYYLLNGIYEKLNDTLRLIMESMDTFHLTKVRYNLDAVDVQRIRSILVNDSSKISIEYLNTASSKGYQIISNSLNMKRLEGEGLLKLPITDPIRELLKHGFVINLDNVGNSITLILKERDVLQIKLAGRFPMRLAKEKFELLK